jgi:uncharacterized protein YigE (DUF2233 family)
MKVKHYSNRYNNKMKYIFVMFTVVVTLVFLGFSAAKADKVWQNIHPGVDYLNLKSIKKPWSQIHIYRINLAKYQLAIATSNKPQQSVYTLSKKYPDFLLATNGGFFDEKYRPIGLRISNYKILSQFKPISWWGVLLQKNNQLQITSSRDYRHHKNIQFAVQCGPRLIINNRIVKLKPGIAERTALGIDKQNRLIIMVTDHHPISTYKAAKILNSNPINSIDALNLDGGHSTQMISNFSNHKQTVLGLSPISDSLLII